MEATTTTQGDKATMTEQNQINSERAIKATIRCMDVLAQTVPNPSMAVAKEYSEAAEQAFREAMNAKSEGDLYECAYQMENYARYVRMVARALDAANGTPTIR